MTIRNPEALEERANNLGTCTGIRLVLVTPQPDKAILEVHFYNANEIPNILDDLDKHKKQAADIFSIAGGHRIPGGPRAGQVRVVSIEKDPGDGKVLRLTVEPVGDYSTYTLRVHYQNMDPVFDRIAFKFRPGCFDNCPPGWSAAPVPRPDPAIDYLAKDYDSFRHAMISWMTSRVPGWRPTSEADMDQVLIDLFSAAADELSDYQDRVMNEAYLATARKRVSLARHARLMDYHIHQGNQASTWLVLNVGAEHRLPAGFRAGTEDLAHPTSVVFATREERDLDRLLDDVRLYTWGDSIPALAAGTTEADLRFSTKANADRVEGLIRDAKVSHLLIEEILNPLTGETRGRNPTRRQLLKLLPGDTETRQDPVTGPVTGEWLVRVRWEEGLKSDYCFTIDCPAGKVRDVSLFQGNLVQAYQGRSHSSVFKAPDAILTTSREIHYERTKQNEALCHLPEGPLAYKDTRPGGEVPPESTLAIEVVAGSQAETWNEVDSLLHSDGEASNFVVETDELGRSLIRFGNGTNGGRLPEGAEVHCTYQVARGLEGNVGADSLRSFDAGAFPSVSSCRNPFDVTGGRSPEPAEEIIRRVPEAYRRRQLRAVTLKDYVDRAEEHPAVFRASAKYMWTGSWRTVRVTVDPVGTTTLTQEVREEVARYLDAIRLIGEDLEVRPPRFIPLDILVSLCVDQDYWPQDLRFVLEQEFSDGYTPDGRMAFFHPDLWTFGQGLRASQIIGRAQAVEGVDHVTAVSLKRWNEATPGTADHVEVRPDEILQVMNDPDHLERGFIRFDLKGGRR